MNGINDVDKDRFSNYKGTRGHSMKLVKRQHRLKFRQIVLVSESLTPVILTRKCNNGTLP